jgi:hypothetical protein
MDLQTAYQSAILPALDLLPVQMRSPEATVMLLSIGQQESRFEYTRQLGNGPAKGYWQMEKGGGVKGVCEHPSSRFWMSHLCEARKVPFTVSAVYDALEFDEVLAAGAARLLLFTDPAKLPQTDAESLAWMLYLRVWRPGKPRPDTWSEYHRNAENFVKGMQ